MLLTSLLLAAAPMPAPLADGCSSQGTCSSTRAVAVARQEKSILETAVAAGAF
jgi:hypothetical protein